MRVRIIHGSLTHGKATYGVGAVVELPAAVVESCDPRGEFLERLPDVEAAPAVVPAESVPAVVPTLPTHTAPRRRKDK